METITDIQPQVQQLELTMWIRACLAVSGQNGGGT